MALTNLKRVRVSIFLLLLSVLFTACGDDKAGFSPKVGVMAPDFQLQELTGSPLKLSDFKGKPVVLNFWATWCAACKVEMPALESLYLQHKSEGLTVLGINFKEDSPTIQSFISKGNFSWPILLDQAGDIASNYRIIGYPTTLYLDRQGVIRAIQIGGLDKAGLEEYLAKILPILTK